MINESVKNPTDTKKKDIVEFLRATTLQPEQLDILVSIFVKQAIAGCGKNASAEEVTSVVKEQILSNTFIEDFTSPFNEVFSQEEIKLLIGFYQSEAMKKFSKNGGELITPLYTAFRKIIQEVLESYPNKEDKPITQADRVISITKENYRKEVQESNLPVILDAYASWCGPCKIVAPIFSELSNELSDKIKFVKLDIEQEQSIAKELEIETMPSFLFFQDGKIVSRQVGAIDKTPFLVKIIQSLL